MSEFVYRIYNVKAKKYCVAGLRTTSKAGKTWSNRGHARSAISCQIRDKDGPRWKDYEIHEYELVRGVTIPAREEDEQPTMAEQLSSMFDDVANGRD